MPVLLEVEKMSSSMRQSLCRRILHEREKRKQEAAEAEKDFERKAKEEEEKRKKLEEENSTLEEIKEQLGKLKEKQVSLKQEKHDLFGQLKKVLGEEERRKRLIEQSEQGTPSGMHYQQHGMSMNPYHLLPQSSRYQSHLQSNQLYLNQGQQLQQGLKRSHSPTPPTTHVIHMYQRPAPMHMSPHRKYDGTFAGHSTYMSPVHGSPHHSINASSGSIHPASGRIHSQFQPSGSSASARTGSGSFAYSNTINKPQEQGLYVDDRGRPRMQPMPQNVSNHQSNKSPYQASHQMRSSSPGRFNIKSEMTQGSFSPGGSSGSTHSRPSSSQSSSRILHQK